MFLLRITKLLVPQESYMHYKISYLCTLCVFLLMVSISYILILVIEKQSRRVRNNDGEDGRKMRIKVCLIVGAQLMTWISLILVAIYFTWFSKSGISDSIIEVFVLVIMPSNSLLNPIFYSDIYYSIEKNLQKVCNILSKTATKTIMTDFTTGKSGNNNENHTQNIAGNTTENTADNTTDNTAGNTYGNIAENTTDNTTDNTAGNTTDNNEKTAEIIYVIAE